MDCTIRVAKIKALISFVVTARLISFFVFRICKKRFSYDAAYVLQTFEIDYCFNQA